MQFGEFVFKLNPKKISVAYENNLRVGYYPTAGERSRSDGKKLRRVKCSGMLFGENPAQPQAELEELMKVAEEKKARLLFVPGMRPFEAYLKECAVEYMDDGRIIPYTLLFVEEGGAV